MVTSLDDVSLEALDHVTVISSSPAAAVIVGVIGCTVVTKTAPDSCSTSVREGMARVNLVYAWKRVER